MSKIRFEPVEHRYFNDKGEELISVSKLLSFYKQPFDEDGSILLRCAQKEGISPEELKKQWEDKKDSACVRGKNFHAQIEHFIKTGQILDKDYKDVIEKFALIKFDGKLKSETIVWSDSWKIAGTTDLINYKDNNVISLGDFKTNQKISDYNPWGRKLLYPVNHLSETEVSIYSLQMSLYAVILEELGYWIDDLTIYYVYPKKRSIKTIPIRFLRQDALNLIEHYYGRKVKNKEVNVQVDDFGF